MKTKEVKPEQVWDFITEYRPATMVKMELQHCSIPVPECIKNELYEALKVISKNEDQLVIATCLTDYILRGDVRLHTTTPFVNTYILDRLYDMYDAWLESQK